MHESTMSATQKTKLRTDVEDFQKSHRGKTISAKAAAGFFRRRGWKLTRPIAHTLQAYGLVERPEGNGIWPEEMRSDVWRIAGRNLVPVRDPKPPVAEQTRATRAQGREAREERRLRGGITQGER